MNKEQNIIEVVARAMRSALDKNFGDYRNSDCFSIHLNSTKSAWCDCAARAVLSAIREMPLDKEAVIKIQNKLLYGTGLLIEEDELSEAVKTYIDTAFEVKP